MSNVYFYLPAVRLAVLFVIVIGRLCSILPARREARRFLLGTLLTTKINTIMKELIDILTSEDKSFEGLPWWMYMFVAPAALVLMCLIGGTLS